MVDRWSRITLTPRFSVCRAARIELTGRMFLELELEARTTVLSVGSKLETPVVLAPGLSLGGYL